MAFVWATVLLTRVRSLGRDEIGAITCRSHLQSHSIAISPLLPPSPGSSRPREPRSREQSELEQDLYRDIK